MFLLELMPTPPINVLRPIEDEMPIEPERMPRPICAAANGVNRPIVRALLTRRMANRFAERILASFSKK
jgi:hypothetical protein